MRINELLGKQIVSADTGEKAGNVEEVLLDAGHHHAVGLLLTGGMLSKQRVLPFRDVQTAGVDAVIVRSLDAMTDASAWVSEGHPTIRSSALRGKPVVTTDGARLGHVGDVIVDAQRGAVTALELVTRQGAPPTVVQLVDDIELARDVIVLPP